MRATIEEEQMFPTKEGEERERNEEMAEIKKDVELLSNKIQDLDMNRFKLRGLLKDRNLAKKKNEQNLILEGELGKITIKITSAKQRIEEANKMNAMMKHTLVGIFEEKRVLEKENQEIESTLEKNLQFTGSNIDPESRKKLEELEAERKRNLENTLKFDKELKSKLQELYNDEEAKARTLLDEKTKLENKLKLTRERLRIQNEKVQKNKDERIRLRNRKVELQILKERLTEETTKLEGEIEEYVKRNDELEKDNEKQKEAISAFLQRIEINTLLKDVDVDDLRLLAQNNTMVNQSIHGLITKWSNLEKADV